MPTVSVIIPSYNAADTIGAAIESLLAQTWRDLEIVVVDDGSTDDTLVRIASYRNRITLITKRNGGAGSARNLGMKASAGELIAWMDSDDVCEPDRIAIQVAVMQSHPQVVLCSSDFSAFNDEEAEQARSFIGSYYDRVRRHGIGALYDETIRLDSPGAEPTRIFIGNVYERLIWGNFVHPPTVMARRSVMQCAGGFDVTMRFNPEYDFILRIARYGKFAYVDAPLLRYRCSANQMSADRNLWKLKVDTARILQKVIVEDADFARRAGVRLQRRIAANLADAAGYVASTDRAQGWHLLLEASRIAVVPSRMWRAMAHLVVPSGLQDTARRLKRRMRARAEHAT